MSNLKTRPDDFFLKYHDQQFNAINQVRIPDEYSRPLHDLVLYIEAQKQRGKTNIITSLPPAAMKLLFAFPKGIAIRVINDAYPAPIYMLIYHRPQYQWSYVIHYTQAGDKANRIGVIHNWVCTGPENATLERKIDDIHQRYGRGRPSDMISVISNFERVIGQILWTIDNPELDNSTVAS